MVTKEYSVAYVQVLEVLKGLSRKEFQRIPKEKIELYERYKDENYTFKLDNKINFNEQVSDVAQSILANLFVRYVATKEDKEEIYKREKQEFIEEEFKKRKNLSLKPLFTNKDVKTISKEESLIVIKEEGIFKKLIHKLKEFFKFRKKR